jgi:hypothetical protein
MDEDNHDMLATGWHKCFDGTVPFYPHSYMKYME